MGRPSVIPRGFGGAWIGQLVLCTGHRTTENNGLDYVPRRILVSGRDESERDRKPQTLNLGSVDGMVEERSSDEREGSSRRYLANVQRPHQTISMWISLIFIEVARRNRARAFHAPEGLGLLVKRKTVWMRRSITDVNFQAVFEDRVYRLVA